jgi:hypothetical protein
VLRSTEGLRVEDERRILRRQRIGDEGGDRLADYTALSGLADDPRHTASAEVEFFTSARGK